jgi:hypothetical protein
MFERYTEKARRTIFFGRYEASQLGSPYIESEHLLLGLLRENKALTHTFSDSQGAVESIRRQVEQQSVIRERMSTSVHLPLSQECKRILAYALEEADKFSHKHIGTEHLFLGVLREYDCLAAKLLRERGVSLEKARKHLGNNPSEQASRSPNSPGLPAGYTAHKLLYNSQAETLILELRAGSRLFLPTRLFTRQKDKKAYEQIGNPTEDVFYESPVTCGSLPIVMFNCSKRGETSVDWEGVYSFNLETKELKLCVSPEKMHLAKAHGRLWIREIVSLSEDGGVLYVNMGVETKVSGGGAIHYSLAKVDLSDQQVTLMSLLLDIHF